MKKCNTCGETRALDNFYPRPSSKDGRHNKCKCCTLEYNRDRYHNTLGVKEAHRRRAVQAAATEKGKRDAKIRSDRFYCSVEGRARSLLNSAKRRGHCSVTLERIVELLEVGRCPMTGVKFDLGNEWRDNLGTKKNPYAPSIDRIDPSKEYTDDNVRIVIWQYNLMKGEISDDQLAYLCGKILEIRRAK